MSQTIQGKADFGNLVRLGVAGGASTALIWSSHRGLLEPRGLSPSYVLDPVAIDVADLMSAVEDLRAQGCEYLLVPADELGLLDPAETFGRELRRTYRLVVEDREAGAVFALHETNQDRAGRVGPDGLPLPPLDLVRLTTWPARTPPYEVERDRDKVLRASLESGRDGAACISAALVKSGFDIGSFESVLDFGCGWGRILRHWHALKETEVHGSDYNPILIEWCRENLNFATFETNGLEPQLAYEDRRFDFTYAISVFTHLDEMRQRAWVAELVRVLRPGGLMLLTVNGVTKAEARLNSESLERFRAGELVVWNPELTNTNGCTVFHPEHYLRETLADGLELIDVITDGAKDARQDQVLWRKP